MDSAQPAQTNGGSAGQPAHAADSCQRWSTLLTEVQRAIALWLPSLRDLAWVNRSWNAIVLWSIIQWLLEELRWGNMEPMPMKLLQTGETIPVEEGEEQQPAHIRLETLIKVTEQRRSKWIKKPNDILPEQTLKLLLDEWKADYKAWMNPSSQAQ